jgi:hypothetical protein
MQYKATGLFGQKKFVRNDCAIYSILGKIKVTNRKLVIYFYDNSFTRLAFPKGAVRMQHTAGGFPSGKICDMVQSWMKEEKGIIHRGRGAHLRCPVSTAVQFSLRDEGSTEYMCVRGR